MKKLKFLSLLCILGISFTSNAKTLVAYYSYTNNITTVIENLTKQIDANVIRIEPAEKGLDYAANNYTIGSAEIQAIKDNPNDLSSYPAIDEVSVDLSLYDTIIIGTPLWWSQMAAPMQTFLFINGEEMSGKNIGLIVSSSSSGISGVESDAHRLIPEGNFIEPSLWIRSSQTSNAYSLISEWLSDINYESLAAIEGISDNNEKESEYFTLTGIRTTANKMDKGIYIKKTGKESKLIIKR